MGNNKDKSRLKFLVLLVTVILLVVIGRFFRIDFKGIEGHLRNFPLFYSGLIFVILYVIVTFFIWLAKDVFRFMAAVLFGPYISTLFVWIAETVNAFILFYFSRLLGRSFVEESLKDRHNKLDKRLGEVSFPWLFLFRATPLVPFRFLDLACGLTKISFRRYLIAVILGSPLRIFWVQYALAGAGEALFKNPYALAEYISGNRPLFLGSLGYFVLVIVVAIKIKRRD